MSKQSLFGLPVVYTDLPTPDAKLGTFDQIVSPVVVIREAITRIRNVTPGGAYPERINVDRAFFMDLLHWIRESAAIPRAGEWIEHHPTPEFVTVYGVNVYPKGSGCNVG